MATTFNDVAVGLTEESGGDFAEIYPAFDFSVDPLYRVEINPSVPLKNKEYISWNENKGVLWRQTSTDSESEIKNIFEYDLSNGEETIINPNYNNLTIVQNWGNTVDWGGLTYINSSDRLFKLITGEDSNGNFILNVSEFDTDTFDQINSAEYDIFSGDDTNVINSSRPSTENTGLVVLVLNDILKDIDFDTLGFSKINDQFLSPDTLSRRDMVQTVKNDKYWIQFDDGNLHRLDIPSNTFDDQVNFNDNIQGLEYNESITVPDLFLNLRRKVDNPRTESGQPNQVNLNNGVGLINQSNGSYDFFESSDLRSENYTPKARINDTPPSLNNAMNNEFFVDNDGNKIFMAVSRSGSSIDAYFYDMNKVVSEGAFNTFNTKTYSPTPAIDSPLAGPVYDSSSDRLTIFYRDVNFDLTFFEVNTDDFSFISNSEVVTSAPNAGIWTAYEYDKINDRRLAFGNGSPDGVQRIEYDGSATKIADYSADGNDNFGTNGAFSNESEGEFWLKNTQDELVQIWDDTFSNKKKVLNNLPASFAEDDISEDYYGDIFLGEKEARREIKNNRQQTGGRTEIE